MPWDEFWKWMSQIMIVVGFVGIVVAAIIDFRDKRHVNKKED